MTRPLSVKDWLAKASPALTSASDPSVPQVLFVTGLLPEESVVDLLAEVLLESFVREGRAEIARYTLPNLRLKPCVGCAGGGRTCRIPCDRNDIESEIFASDDEMGMLHEQMKISDILILASDVRAGSVNSHVQRFLERLEPFATSMREGISLLENKVAIPLIAGSNASEVASRLMATLMGMGYSFGTPACAALTLLPGTSLGKARDIFNRGYSLDEDALEAIAKSALKTSKFLKGMTPHG